MGLGTLSLTFCPIFEKNLLNSSAMVCGSEILVSFITNVEGKLFDFL